MDASPDLAHLQDQLPPQIQEMAARIGLPATLTVVSRLGGTTWRVAKGKTQGGEAKRAALAEIVGSEIEELLHREYAGEILYLAQCKAAGLQWRNMLINAHFEQGIRKGIPANTLVAELARENQLSDRRIWTILKQPLPPLPEQGRLSY
ncbi:Mor transcription activator family protein [Pseudomonas aeruginosa]|uniref:Mor transcription activator family protein n=1 Tax=Pseudomonas aeruginosa TaxID=287 RepID=UPI0015C1C062|nr:Mor transcription activator family protein [Pseudomonas aeruginosa]EKW5974342.1 hypothetical protein [Pseudomonas aeruginosa]EMB5660455.1 hypothetical protein [Pseudomonas aeruginosa]MBX6202724.1 hypothetical protein [Pseudomonas aeruginosa]MBX6760761.1 hypothetical protein [Pseudomonas aeruginosa]MCT5895762.1 hypothetical protein [Pseudomonas aeruginosa]